MCALKFDFVPSDCSHFEIEKDVFDFGEKFVVADILENHVHLSSASSHVLLPDVGKDADFVVDVAIEFELVRRAVEFDLMLFEVLIGVEVEFSKNLNFCRLMQLDFRLLRQTGS